MDWRQTGEHFKWNDRVASWVSHLLAAGMIASLVFAAASIGRMFVPGWHAESLVMASFFVALESMWSRQYVTRSRLNFPETDWLVYRGAEWLLLLVVLRFYAYFWPGSAFDAAALNAGLAGLWQALWSRDYLLLSGVSALVWMLGTQFASELALLGGDEHLLSAERSSGISNERREVRVRLANMVFLLGGVMVMLAGILRQDFKGTNNLQGSSQTAIGTNVVIFFILGLALLSVTQFSVKRALWGLDRFPIPRGMAARWVGYTLLFLLTIALVALVLPGNPGLDLVSALKWVAWFLAMIAGVLIFLALLPFLLVALLVIRLAGVQSAVEASGIPLALRGVLPSTTPQGGWGGVLQAIFFWVFLLLLTGYAVTVYWKAHRERLGRFGKWPVGQWWQKLSSWLKRLMGATRGQAARWLQEGKMRLRRASGRAEERLRLPLGLLRRMNPRQRIIFYYLGVIRRGKEAGLPRKPGQTPDEYQAGLGKWLAGLDGYPGDDLASLTAQFVEARYSTHAIDEEQARFGKQRWQRLLRALRRLRKSAGN